MRKFPIHASHAAFYMASAISTTSDLPPTAPETPPDVFDALGWAAIAGGFGRCDHGQLIKRLDEFKAAGAWVVREPMAGCDDWRGPLLARLLDHVKDTIDRLLSREASSERQEDVARTIAVAAIRDPRSPHHENLRCRFHQTISEIVEDAARIIQLSGTLRCNARVVPIASVPEPRVESHEERVDQRLAIARAIESEPHAGRKASLELAYEGLTKSEIAERLGVSTECVRLWLRGFRGSPFLAPYAVDFVDRRLP